MRPASTYRPRKREHHRCFELAVRFQTDDPTWTLVHGHALINGMPCGRAWLERDGWVYDPVLDESLPWLDYAEREGAMRLASFSNQDAAREMLVHDTYGPWLQKSTEPIDKALMRCSSTERFEQLWRRWDEVPKEQRPEKFLSTLRISDMAARRQVLELLRSMNLPIFDGDAARGVWQSLPARVTVFRGASNSEFARGPFGVSWTLSKTVAEFFALTHRFRPRNGLVLRATISKSAIAALVWDRKEEEVLVLPGGVFRRNVQVDRKRS